MHALPNDTYFGDIHCVTTWSKLDTTFVGVSLDTLLGATRPTAEAAYVMAHSQTGYTTNIPLADVTGGKAAGFEPLRTWFTALYEVLLGQSQGPRFGSFVAIFGVERTVALIERALAGELAAA